MRPASHTPVSAAPLRRPAAPPARVSAPVLVPGPQAAPSPSAAPCACGGTCPRCSSPSNTAGPAVPTDVQLHPSAPEVTAPLRARAVTIGQDIYFHPGQYQPETPQGQELLRHELAHTQQTRGAAPSSDLDPAKTSEPNDALEQNADALASGETSHALAAPAGAMLRSPFDSESAADQGRRQTLLTSINHAQTTLLRLLQSGGLLRGEEVAVQRGGVRGVAIPANAAGTPQEVFISYTQRDVRLRRIMRALQAMSTLYRSAPIPTGFAPPVQDPADGSYSSQFQFQSPDGPMNTVYSGQTPEWADLQSAYQRYLVSQGLFGDEYEWDWYYLDPTAVVVPGSARGAPRIGGGIQSGAYMVFPDVDREPLRYWRLDGFIPVPRGAQIIEFWHDDFGYYYTHNGQRIDVPSPWSSGTK